MTAEPQLRMLEVRKGSPRPLLGRQFKAGLGWDPAEGQEDVDLDLWVLRFRKNADGTTLCEAIYWGNKPWERPDLGVNSQGYPWIATPELDVIYMGDDRTGKESEQSDGESKPKDGYDENALIDLDKAPVDTYKYAIFATYYDDPEVDPPTKFLGMANNVLVGVKQEGTDNVYVVKAEDRKLPEADSNKLKDEHLFETTLLVATLDLKENGKWELTAVDKGYTDSMPTIAKQLGVAGFKDAR